MAQTQELLGEQVAGVAVKQGLSTFAAVHLHPSQACARIRDAAEQAVHSAGSAQPFHLAPGATIELDFDHQSRADQAALAMGVERVGDRTIAFRPADGLEFCHQFRTVMKLATIRMSP